MAKDRVTRPRLRDVTVCAADSVYPELAARALEICLDRCDFGDAILFSDTAVSGRFRHVPIARLKSLDDYSRFCLRDMPHLTETPYVLVVQWDGYVVDPAAWTSAFLRHDYLGAVLYPTEGGTLVGNGGFSLRSRKLLDALPKLPVLPGVAEDWAISKTFRNVLEADFGIRFATRELADRFSYEVKYPGHPTFGFHGLPNFWRHERDEAVVRVFGSLPRRALLSLPFFGLILSSLKAERLDLARSLYALIREGRTPAHIKVLMTKWIPADLVEASVDRLERLSAAG